MRYILYLSVALGSILLILLSLSSANTAISGDFHAIFLYINSALSLLLVGLICYQIWHLYQSTITKKVGSRLNLRLLTSFVFMSIIPGLIVYVVSVNFLSRSIESWFNVKVESALDGGITLGQRALDIMLTDLKKQAENMAYSLSLQQEKNYYSMLNDLREKAGIEEAALLSTQGAIILVSSDIGQDFLPDLPGTAQLRQARRHIYGRIEPIVNKGLYMRVLAPVETQGFAEETRILQLMQPIPKSLSNTAESVQAVYQDYQTLSFSRGALKDIFTLTLTMVLLLSMLSALAIAFVLSRRLTQPISLLAEGTKLIASGDYTQQLPAYGNDELGVLVKSFNSMTKQLSDAKQASEHSRLKVEAARTYLDATLAHLSSGVITINERAELRVYNLAATNILGVSLVNFKNKAIDSIATEYAYLAEVVDTITQHFEATQSSIGSETDISKQVEITLDAEKKVLILRLSRLPEASGHDMVVVIDDATAMVQAQRDEAWAEVARRLAHEIKNPLTPIQLSAERMRLKLYNKLQAQDADMLVHATETIVNQVQAMKTMVNEFSEYARTPQVQLCSLNLNTLIHDVSQLYASSGVELVLKLEPKLAMIIADATMMRQILHNLLQNAKDALTAQSQPQVIVQTSTQGHYAKLSIIDNGTGFSPEIFTRAFEPYVTSKSSGTGLGLAIVKKMVEEQQGQIKIDNLVQGASVSIWLPLELIKTKRKKAATATIKHISGD